MWHHHCKSSWPTAFYWERKVRLFLTCLIAKLKNQFLSETRIIYRLLKCLSLTRWMHLQCKIGTMSRCAYTLLLASPYLTKILQFVLSHMNGFPKESRDADFSRIKPWYLDGQWVETHSFKINCTHHFFTSAVYLRQSILLTAYETAETRSLYNSSLKNVAGKIRTEKHWQPIAVPDGIDQVDSAVSW